MSTPQTPVDSQWEWPLVGNLIVMAFAAPLIALEVLDVCSLFSALRETPTIRGFLITCCDVALMPVFGIYAYSLCRRGSQGAYLAALGAFVTLLVCFSFRGTDIRFGTFDQWAAPAWPWEKFLGIGLVIGCSLGLLAARRSPETRLRNPGLTWIWPAALVAIAWTSRWEARVHQVPSMWAPTRPIALTLIGFGLLVLFIASELCRRSYESQSVHSY